MTLFMAVVVVGMCVDVTLFCLRNTSIALHVIASKSRELYDASQLMQITFAASLFVALYYEYAIKNDWNIISTSHN